MATTLSDATRARIAAAYGDLLDNMAAGLEMVPAYAAAGVTADKVRVWRFEDRSGEREKEWQAAREQSADAYADKVASIADNPGANSHTARVKLDALRWLAAKRNPRYYSDKATLDVNVRQVDLTRIIEAAAARLTAQGRVIDADIVPPALLELL